MLLFFKERDAGAKILKDLDRSKLFNQGSLYVSAIFDQGYKSKNSFIIEPKVSARREDLNIFSPNSKDENIKLVISDHV